jgi:hypothetical protein
MTGEFSVCQFFSDGFHKYHLRWVDAKTAVYAAKACTESAGARSGLVQRIIITDGGDCTNFEWEFGKGITYPPEMAHH